MAPSESRVLRIFFAKSRAYLTNSFKISRVKNQVLTLLILRMS